MRIDLTPIKLALPQANQLPQAESNAGRICQYTGATTDSYINGAFYKSNGTVWEPVEATTQLQADWLQQDTAAKDFIKNKPASLPASDVSAWAKAPLKPTYTASEVHALPDTTVIPTELPNPSSLTITNGSATAVYNGSENISVEISSGAIGTKITGSLPITGWESENPWFINTQFSASDFQAGEQFIYVRNEPLGLVVGSTYPSAVINLNGVDYNCVMDPDSPDYTEFTVVPGSQFGWAAGAALQLMLEQTIDGAPVAIIIIVADGLDISDISNPVADPNKSSVFIASANGPTEGAVQNLTIKSVQGLSEGSPIYTIAAQSIKTNSTVQMYVTDSGRVKSRSKTDGSLVVTRSIIPTAPIPYTLQVVETSTEGTFEIINDYVPASSSDTENFTLESANWIVADESLEPFEGYTTITAINNLSEYQEISPILTAIDQARYGVVIGQVEDQIITLYCMTTPSVNIDVSIVERK